MERRQNLDRYVQQLTYNYRMDQHRFGRGATTTYPFCGSLDDMTYVMHQLRRTSPTMNVSLTNSFMSSGTNYKGEQQTKMIAGIMHVSYGPYFFATHQ